MTGLLLIFHIVVFAFSQAPFAIANAENKWAIVAASSIGISVAICLPVIRYRWYETFVRAHQCLAIVSVYGIWVHIAPQRLLLRLHVYVLVGIAGLSVVLLGLLVIYRNGIFRSRLPRADLMHAKGAVLVRVVLSRPVRVKAGQYICLWLFIPSTSFHALIEYHPFVVASWSDAPLDTLDLLIEPRTGFTRHLLHRSQTRQDLCRALFSGPHGNSIPVGDYEVVLMVASGYGIAAQLPYLKELLHGYNSRKARSRRIHLVWELKTIDLAIAIESLLNNALVDDTLDNGYVSKFALLSRFSAYWSEDSADICGLPDWCSIMREEVEGKYIKRVQEEASTRGDMIVTGK
ncbi:cell surface metalloreductase (FreA) [Metarhizium brunneum]